ncbi:MAG: asparaginase domain-containing protein [Planctomycetota bacterium]|jgi:L-asparaginase
MDQPRTTVALISTGGTIEKTYDELSGILHNRVSVLDVMLSQLVLEGVDVHRIALMNKDSRDMEDADHDLIADAAALHARSHGGVVIVHGTDRLRETGERLVERLGVPPVPIVLTGAMRPWALKTTDAVQNLTEALLAVQLVAPGVYVAMHNVLLRFPGVVKDVRRGTFVRAAD